MDGRGVVIKAWRLDTPRRRLQALLHRTPAFGHWRGARLLEQARVPTARCLAIYRGRDEAGAACEWLVMERLEGATVLEHLARGGLGVAEEHRLAAALGRQVAQMERRGVFNRDHKASNLIVRSPGDTGRDSGADAIAVIDAGGVRRGGGRAERMLASLAIECLGTGVLPRRALLARVLRGWQRQRAVLANPGAAAERGSLRLAWEAISARIARHGDPTPKVNPLAPPREE